MIRLLVYVGYLATFVSPVQQNNLADPFKDFQLCKLAEPGYICNQYGIFDQKQSEIQTILKNFANSSKCGQCLGVSGVRKNVPAVKIADQIAKGAWKFPPACRRVVAVVVNSYNKSVWMKVGENSGLCSEINGFIANSMKALESDTSAGVIKLINLYISRYNEVYKSEDDCKFDVYQNQNCTAAGTKTSKKSMIITIAVTVTSVAVVGGLGLGFIFCRKKMMVVVKKIGPLAAKYAPSLGKIIADKFGKTTQDPEKGPSDGVELVEGDKKGPGDSKCVGKHTQGESSSEDTSQTPGSAAGSWTTPTTKTDTKTDTPCVPSPQCTAGGPKTPTTGAIAGAVTQTPGSAGGSWAKSKEKVPGNDGGTWTMKPKQLPVWVQTRPSPEGTASQQTLTSDDTASDGVTPKKRGAQPSPSSREYTANNITSTGSSRSLTPTKFNSASSDVRTPSTKGASVSGDYRTTSTPLTDATPASSLRQLPTEATPASTGEQTPSTLNSSSSSYAQTPDSALNRDINTPTMGKISSGCTYSPNVSSTVGSLTNDNAETPGSMRDPVDMTQTSSAGTPVSVDNNVQTSFSRGTPSSAGSRGYNSFALLEEGSSTSSYVVKRSKFFDISDGEPGYEGTSEIGSKDVGGLEKSNLNMVDGSAGVHSASNEERSPEPVDQSSDNVAKTRFASGCDPSNENFQNSSFVKPAETNINASARKKTKLDTGKKKRLLHTAVGTHM